MMRHPFGDLIRSYLSKKPDFNQRALAYQSDLDEAVISKMLNGERLANLNARKRILRIIEVLLDEEHLSYVEEANEILETAGWAKLSSWREEDNELLRKLVNAPDDESFGSKQRLLSTLVPLSQEQRKRINNAKEIAAVGINLFRFLSAYQLEFRNMLSNDGFCRILIAHPHGAVMKMAALRSESNTPEKTQTQRVIDTLDLISIWKANTPESNLKVRLIDYLPPYSITIIHPTSATDISQCLVRLNGFRSSTTTAPAITPNPTKDKEWFEYFSEQFEKMWDCAESA